MRNCILWALCLAILTPIVLFADDNGGGIRVQTIKVSSVSPFLTLKFWDYEAEDGDWVRIVVDGETYREFELKNAPKTVSIPILFSDNDEVFVNVIGTQSGNGPVTYAVQATGLGSSVEVYKNYADVGTGNSYRIVKTKDDIFSVGVSYVAGLFGMGEERDEEEYMRQQRENVASFLNECLSAFPNAESLPIITADMIKIDPSAFKGNEEMKYDADLNQFILKKDISDFSFGNHFEEFWGKWLLNPIPQMSSKHTYIDSIKNQGCHELSHYVQDKLSEKNSDQYMKMSLHGSESDRASQLILIEGFAVTMGMKTSEDLGALTDHRNTKDSDTGAKVGDTGISYIEAAARYVDKVRVREQDPTIREALKNTADAMRAVDYTKSEKDWRLYSADAGRALKNVPAGVLLKGIMR